MSGRASPLKASAAFVIAWTGISGGVVMYLEGGEVRILVPVLAALTATAALWHPVGRPGLLTAVVAAAAFAGLRYALEGVDGLAVPALAAAVSFVGLGILADLLTQRAEADALQRRHDTLLIDELTPTSETGAMKWQHARKELADEIGRGRRYKYPVSLVLVGLDPVIENADEAAVAAGVKQRSELVRLLLSKTRTSDRVTFHGNDQVALMLPHTPLKGALMFLDKNLPEIKEAAGLDPRMGVAEFPTDAGSADDLVAEAEAALEFGKASGVRIVSRSLLMGAQEAAASTDPGSPSRAGG